MPASPSDQRKQTLLEAILPHVVFDGWSPESFTAAVSEVGMTPQEAKTLCPRGAVDLAVLHHQNGDRDMQERLAVLDLSALPYSGKVAEAVWQRLDLIEDREPIRRASTLFALPHLAPLGAKLVWGTADCIWTTLGDTSRDVNWYSKRATLSGVFAASVLFWLGDDSANSVATREFIDRRIADVMRFEKAKAQVRETPSLRPLGRLIDTMTQGIKAPPKGPRSDVPGYWHTPK